MSPQWLTKGTEMFIVWAGQEGHLSIGRIGKVTGHGDAKDVNDISKDGEDKAEH